MWEDDEADTYILSLIDNSTKVIGHISVSDFSRYDGGKRYCFSCHDDPYLVIINRTYCEERTFVSTLTQYLSQGCSLQAYQGNDFVIMA